MTHEDLRDVLREGIVEKSIQILRNHGKSDREIKEMMLKDFAQMSSPFYYLIISNFALE